MPSDPALYALVLENNRLLKALTERMTPKPSQCTAECSDPRGLHAMAAIMGGTANPHDLTGINSVVRGNPKPLTESDMAQVLKTGEVPRAYSATERLVRGQVADRLTAILFPGSARPNWTLEEAFSGVANAAEGAKKWREREEAATGVRDAALEEVERIATSMSLRNRDASDTADSSDMRATYRTRAAAFREMALECRALKSKPAPVDLHLSAKDEDEILASGGGFSHVSGKTTQSGPAPQPSKNPGEIE